MEVFLPDLMEVLQKGDEHIKTKALFVIQNIMNGLKKTEASPFAVHLAEKLLPLFDKVRLMEGPETRRWALGTHSCPSAQPCEQRLEQRLLLSFLPRAPVEWLLGSAAQPSFSLAAAPRAPRAAQLPCGAGSDILPRPQGKGLRLSWWGMARRHCRAPAPGVLLSPSVGSSSPAWLVPLVGCAGWLGQHSEAQALPGGSLLSGLS